MSQTPATPQNQWTGFEIMLIAPCQKSDITKKTHNHEPPLQTPDRTDFPGLVLA
jgi:hypothetical protein